MRKLSAAARGAQGGFTLVEALVASALLGLAAATVMSLLLRSGLNSLEARRTGRLAAMARSSLDELVHVRGGAVDQVWCPSSAAWQDACGDEAPRFRRVTSVAPVVTPIAVPGRAGTSVLLEQVTVEVTALQAGRAAGARTMRLVTLRPAETP